MAAIIGSKAELYVYDSGPQGASPDRTELEFFDATDANWVRVGRVNSANVSLSDGLADTSSNDSTVRTQILALTEVSIDVTARWDQNDSGQKILKDAKFGRNVVRVYFRPQVLEGEREITMDAVIGDMSLDTSTEEAQSLNFTLNTSGNIKFSKQPAVL